MTQEEKELLLKDLCTRLPYDIKVDYEGSTYYLNEINPSCKNIDYITVLIQNEKRSLCATNVQIEEIKPYLRLMSSITEEEKRDFPFPYYFDWIDSNFSLLCSNDKVCASIGFDEMYEITDWLNAHHFDSRKLIEKGLALEAKEGMYKKNKV